MSPQRKSAYRHLLYFAMLETRTIAWRRVRWWDPWSVRAYVRECRYVGNLGDAMHNLALAAASDFEGFREDWFWVEIKCLAEKFPSDDRYNYFGIFSNYSELPDQVNEYAASYFNWCLSARFVAFTGPRLIRRFVG